MDDFTYTVLWHDKYEDSINYEDFTRVCEKDALYEATMRAGDLLDVDAAEAALLYGVSAAYCNGITEEEVVKAIREMYALIVEKFASA